MRKSRIMIVSGAIYVWCCAFVAWIQWIKSENFVQQIAGYIGAAIVSASMLSILIYINRLEERIMEVEIEK